MLLERFFSKPTPRAKAWIIDPVNQSITLKEGPNFKSLIPEIVGDDAESLKLDNHDNVVWVSDTDTNERYAYWFEGMGDPWNVFRFSKGLIVSLGPLYWDVDAICAYLRWYDSSTDDSTAAMPDDSSSGK
jgi:hypothetical protein